MILLLDLDNVVRDAAWRDKIANDEGWDAYHAQGINDFPVNEVIEMVRALDTAGWDIVAVTGCTDNYRDQTLKWLIQNEVPIDTLLMRKKGDFRPTTEVKLELVSDIIIGKKYDTILMIDDRDDVCVAFRNMGITSLQCYKQTNYRPDAKVMKSKPVSTRVKQHDQR